MASQSISVASLEKSFADETAVQDVSLDIASGEFCVVVGPSGCGKSVLLDCIAGITDPDTGAVSLRGQDVTETPTAKRNVGYIFQEFDDHLFNHKTVEENILFGLRLQDGSGTEADWQQRVDEMIELLSIESIRDKLPSELSGGQQQRVEIARQLVRDCDTILLDDPLSDLDYKLEKRLELELRQLHADRRSTFLYVTHNQEQALKLADKLVVMNDGRIEQIGTPQSIYDDPENAFVARFIGDSNAFIGSLTDVDGDTVHLETDVGPLEAKAVGTGDPPEESIFVIRPEAIAIGDAAGWKDNTIEGRLQGRTFTGNRTEFFVTVDSLEDNIQVVEPGNQELGAVGETVSIGWDSIDGSYFSELSRSSETTLETLMEY